MPSTAETLHAIATFTDRYGLHTGENFARLDLGITRLDICAIAYICAEQCAPPAVFFTDEGASRELIEASEPTMTALRALSASITNYEVPDSDGRPDVIEHVSQWTFTNPIGCTQPPTTAEVIGRIVRAADALDTHASAA